MRRWLQSLRDASHARARVASVNFIIVSVPWLLLVLFGAGLWTLRQRVAVRFVRPSTHSNFAENRGQTTERQLLGIIFVAFCIVCFGAIFYLPEMTVGRITMLTIVNDCLGLALRW